ncbi:tetratricopeptide repeat protein [Bartonella sp. A05]|uniref:tetratricopeptide repeat protein n=1 Tax=Bartonella sp. A05 TaxID=2967261 RepID=UPI0022A9E354|nr:tetratricopeptide repeat protein [Bartonella sp. A05]MCZ2203897.1 tetratricopeptide repeat protein [Bartonella sp. A05]
MRNATISCFFTLFIAGSIVMLSHAYSKMNTAIDTRSFTGSYLAGRLANYENKTNLAIDYFKQALVYQPNNVEIQKEIFEAMLSVGAFKEAVKQAKKLKKQGIVTPFISLTLSIENLIKKDYKNVQSLLKFEASPPINNPISELIGAWAIFGSGNQSKAIKDLEKRLGPIWYDLFIHYHLALMNDLAGHTQNAKKHFIQALTNQQAAIIAPDTYERIIIAYASFQVRHKMRSQAIETLRHGEQILLGRESLKNIRKRIEKGANLKKLVETSQQGAGEVLYSFGAFLNQKNSERVARIFEQLSLTLYPQNDAILFQLANISAKLKDFDQAIKLYRALPLKSPYHKDGQLRLALTLANNNNRDEAIQLLTSLKEKFPNDRYILTALANIHMQKNNFSESIKIIDYAIAQITDFQKEDWKLFYQRGIAFERLQQWPKAEIDLRKALELFPNQPQVLNYLGYSLIERNQNLEESLQILQKASELDPPDGYILDSLGWAHYKLKQYDKAIQMLESAVRLKPEDPTFNDHLGDAYWQVGRKREAVFQWNHALDGEHKNPEKIKEKMKFGLKETAMYK